jgi:trigger factor
MQVTETNAEGLKHEFMVVVAADDIEQQVQRRLTDLRREVRLPGFRPGKVPLTVLRKRFGQSVMGEVLERVVGDSSVAAMRERNLRPALQPKVEIVSFNEGTDLAYRMAVEVLPEIQPMNFSELELERLKPEVPDQEIDEALERIAKQQRKTEAVERPAENGDVAVIDFTGSIDGVEFPGGHAENYSLELGSNSFIPGFEAQIVGAKAGDELSVDVTFPEDYGGAELAGKAATFAVKVKEVRAATPQPIDDSLAEAVGMENLEGLRQAVRERIERDYAGIARQRLKRDLLDKLADAHHFDVPPGMVDIEFNSIWQQYEAERDRLRQAKEAAAKNDGAAPDDEAKTAGESATAETAPVDAAPIDAVPAEAAPGDAVEEGKSEDAIKAEYRGIAERRVRLGLLLAEVGRHNNIIVSQDEFNRVLGEEVRRYPGHERKVLDYYRDNPQAADALRAPVYEDKVVDFIVELAKVTDRAVPPAELMAEAEEDEDAPAA